MLNFRSTLLPTTGMLLLVCLASCTGLDMSAQRLLFNVDLGLWWIDQNAFLPRLVFYHAPRGALALAALTILVLLTLPASRRPGSLTNRQLAFVLSVLLLVPVATNLVKRYSGVPCPYQVAEFGGDRPHVPLGLALTVDHDIKAGQCWPSGHASSGFAFIGLAYVAGTRRRRRGILLATIAAGLVTGTYQVLKGAHFPSHVIGTLLLALIIANSLARILDIDRAASDAPGPSLST